MNARFVSGGLYRVGTGMRGVLVAPDVALLHFQLDLALGSRAAPDVFHVLIGALFRRVAPGWRIAPLFTTNANRG